MIDSLYLYHKKMLGTRWQDLVGTKLAERYVLRNLVSAGSGQAEFTASDEQQKDTVSVALLDVEPGEAGDELAAIGRAKQLQHPNLLQVLDGGECELEGSNVLYIATERSQGTLAAAPRPDPAALLDDLLPPLEWIHSQNLVYRNLDPETVVRAGEHWKLADLSQIHSAGKFDGAAPSPHNAPPEAASGLILPAWDFWSLGVLLRDLLQDETSSLSPPFDSIVRGCLETDHRRRFSSQDIRRLLQAPAAPEPEAEAVFESTADSGPAPEPAAATRSRVPIIVAAVIALMGVLLTVMLRPRHEAAPAPAEKAPPVATVPAVPKQAAPASPPVERPSPFSGKAAKAAPPASVPAAAAPPAAPNQHVGRADYFADDLEGNLTASGEKFSNDAMTAASREFPMGTRLRVTNLGNNRSVTVRVNDRGGSRSGFIITLTRRAADELGFVKAGSARVKVERAK